MKSDLNVLAVMRVAAKGVACIGGLFFSLSAAALNLAQSPLYLTVSQPPLIMLTMSKDHKLYYEAYNDYSDLDGDGTLDVGYKPGSIDYYGYFDSYKCYSYASGVFTPVAVTSNKKCTGTNDSYWSGDFLNYVTTSRIDAIRKVLYGGKRSTDSSTQTILERTYIPQEAHSWGKEYESQARDGYLISEYTPLTEPSSGYRHLFASTSLNSDTTTPLMRVLTNSRYRIWEWVSIEGPVAGSDCDDGSGRTTCTTAGGSSWSVVPASTTEGLSNVTMTTYNITGSGGHPASESDFNTLVVNYGTAVKRCGSGLVATINGSGNPYDPGSASCSDDYYMTIFTGTLNIQTAGTYTFAVDGDDAVDVFIDGTQVVGYYGGHGACNCTTHSGTRTLSAGAHTITFRHEEQTGGDSYKLMWQRTEPASVMTDYTVRVEVCKTISGATAAENFGREANCQAYGSSTVVYKPTGMLHKYGQNNGMYFGLISGSFDQNTNGGVLRKAVSSITNEIETTTGIFKESGSTCGTSGSTACVKGIVGTINRFTVTRWNGSSYQNCGWIVDRPMASGECEMWGNPLAEMMYEGLRYFSGQTSPTSTFTTSSTRDDALELPKVTSWTNPYGSGQMPTCSKPYFMLISDVYPSFDSDSLPGADSNFSPVSGLTSSFNGNTLNVATQGQTIWDLEFGTSASKNIFIGQVGSSATSAPTVKAATSFGNIRGLAPADPTRQGSYYTGSVAYFSHIADVSSASGAQKATTYSIALAAPLPKIEVPVGTSKVVIAPFAKSVGGFGISEASTAFQPTNQIVDFYIDIIRNTTAGNTDAAINGGRPYYRFRINYEDVEQGADHDMDAIVVYEVLLNADNTVTVKMTSEYAAGSIIQHMGYVISGTTADGTYLEVRDKDTASGSDKDYYLDTPNTAGVALPLSTSRTFTPSSSASTGEFLRDPLWYAAKYGGFSDANGNNIPESTEWDADGDGVPDNYFLVVNPLRLEQQMDKALAKIRDDSGTSAALSTNSFSFQSDTLLFQSRFNSDGWSGELNAYPVSATGIQAPAWQAQARLVSVGGGSRVILTYDLGKTWGNRGIPFRWDDMSSGGTLQTSLNKDADGTTDSNGSNRVTYLRGDAVSGMRTRPVIAGTTNTNKLGDIVNSQAQYVGRPNFGYADGSYASFSVNNASRTKVVYVGANDGMVHGFNASTGDEVLAYVPSEMYRTRGTKQLLSKLTRSDYGKSTNPHRFYVDGTPTMGDICTGTCSAAGDWKTILVGGMNGGGQGIYALDITNPSTFAESAASSIVKWEFLDRDHDGNSGTSTITGDAEMGYSYSRPFIVRLCTSRDTAGGTAPFDQPKPCNASAWYVVFGNGYNNTEADGYAGTGDAVLYVVNANTGYLAKKIAVNEADSVNPNGLSEIAPVDLDGDGTIDYIYAGDLKGNLWRFDFVSDNTNNWASGFGSAANPDPLYVAYDEQSPTKVRQPITTAPDVIRHPEGGTLVVFGTGSYLDTNDTTTTQVQTIYGIWDNNAVVSSTNRSNLQQQTINTSTVTATSTVTIGTTTVSTDHDYRTVSSNAVDWNTKKGWYMNLPDTGERVAFNPEIRGGNILKFVTTVPSSDICAAGGYSWEYYINALTGARLTYSPFMDLQATQDFGGVTAYASGRKSTVGITPPGTILTEGQGRGSVFTGGSTGEMDYYKVNLGQATAGRVSWREILGD